MTWKWPKSAKFDNVLVNLKHFFSPCNAIIIRNLYYFLLVTNLSLQIHKWIFQQFLITFQINFKPMWAFIALLLSVGLREVVYLARQHVKLHVYWKICLHCITGMEAIWKVEVENFPAFIVVDNKGNDFFKEWQVE